MVTAPGDSGVQNSFSKQRVDVPVCDTPPASLAGLGRRQEDADRVVATDAGPAGATEASPGPRKLGPAVRTVASDKGPVGPLDATAGSLENSPAEWAVHRTAAAPGPGVLVARSPAGLDLDSCSDGLVSRGLLLHRSLPWMDWLKARFRWVGFQHRHCPTHLSMLLLLLLQWLGRQLLRQCRPLLLFPRGLQTWTKESSRPAHLPPRSWPFLMGSPRPVVARGSGWRWMELL